MAGFSDIIKAIGNKFDGAVLESRTEGKMPYIVVDSSRLVEVCRFLKEDERLAFDFLSAIAGSDKGEELELVYFLYSYPRRHSLNIKVRVPASEPVAPSVSGVWKAADWHERETYDLLGIKFDGHTDLRRILLPPDWEGHPLRKNYKYPTDYGGIELRRDEEGWPDPGDKELYE